MKLKLDLHVHTSKSSDAVTPLEDMAEICKLRGIDGIAITDHNQTAKSIPEGLLAIHGTEVSSRAGHIIGLGIKQTIERGLSPEETIERIRKSGGIAFLPHPYDLFRAGVKPDRLSILPDAIEVINGTSILSRLTWPPAKNYAKRTGLPQVAGSDSHIPQTVGRAYTLVETDSHDEFSIIEAIQAGRTTPFGRQISIVDRTRKLILQAQRSL